MRPLQRQRRRLEAGAFEIELRRHTELPTNWACIEPSSLNTRGASLSGRMSYREGDSAERKPTGSGLKKSLYLRHRLPSLPA